ncbi:MAG: HD domain-containing protein [Alphaproteobacteria bacterium]|nr:HD domain-containing protein [Alphaproteobacteria bacterium]
MSYLTSSVDTLIESYDVDQDPLIQGEFTPVHNRLWHFIENYADNINEYGGVMCKHLQRTSAIGQAFMVQELGFSERAGRNFYDANLLHDLGKCHPCYDPNIWQTPHRPTPEEREEKREHTRLGVEYLDLSLTHSPEALQEHPHVQIIKSLQLHHHERIDGTGYEGFQGKDLSKIIKMICIIDAFDGDMIHRPHQPAKRTPREALERLKNGAKYQGAFDTEILDQFIDFTLKAQ